MWVTLMRRTIPLLIAIWTLASWLVLGGVAAHANRFGPPWQARVVADNAFVYSQADLNSAIVGPLGHGSIVAVIGQQTDNAGHEWTMTPPGPEVVSVTSMTPVAVRMVPASPTCPPPSA